MAGGAGAGAGAGGKGGPRAVGKGRDDVGSVVSNEEIAEDMWDIMWGGEGGSADAADDDDHDDGDGDDRLHGHVPRHTNAGAGARAPVGSRKVVAAPVKAGGKAVAPVAAGAKRGGVTYEEEEDDVEEEGYEEAAPGAEEGDDDYDDEGAVPAGAAAAKLRRKKGKRAKAGHGNGKRPLGAGGTVLMVPGAVDKWTAAADAAAKEKAAFASRFDVEVRCVSLGGRGLAISAISPICAPSRPSLSPSLSRCVVYYVRGWPTHAPYR